MSQPLLILGASARAAAWSARRAGFDPAAGDLFGDEDLRACCPTWRCERYPNDLEKIAANAPSGPWMYTGGLENYPRLVDRIAQQRSLWGNPGSVLRAVRNPFQVAEVLADAGVATPAMTVNPRGLPCDGTWLRKPRRSSGGYEIHRLSAPCDPAKSTSDYFQEFVPGVPQSAVFVATGSQAALLGVTEQLLGNSLWEANPFADRSAKGFASHNATGTGPQEFRYAGSIGPLDVSAGQRQQWQTIGNRLASAFDLVGLFGVDALVADETVWPVEVNPRYTASIEIIERGAGLRTIALHAQACQDSAIPPIAAATPTTCNGKAIVYADRQTTIAESFAGSVEQSNAGQTWPQIADIPSIGTTILDRHPVVTIFAEGTGPSEVRERLRRRAADVRAVLGPIGC